MVVAAVLAGGRGARFGGDAPKQYAELGGEPVLVRSVRAFTSSGLADVCIVSVPGDRIEQTEALLSGFARGNDCPVRVIAGGDSRGETLLKLLDFVMAQNVPEDTVLVTHDAVRPFVTRRMIAENIDAARRVGACNTCLRATDTVFISEDGTFITSVPDRRTVYHAQTPQSFLARELYDLCKKIPAADFAAMTDGCSVFTYFGKPVAMVEGDRDNIKITFPEDLARAEQILKRFSF